MRPNFAAQAGGAVLVAGLLYWHQLAKKDSRRVVLSLLASLAALAFLMIPWMSVLYRSNGTVALPPFYGWTDPAFLDMSSRQGLWTDLRNGVSFLFRPEVVGFLSPPKSTFVRPRAPWARQLFAVAGSLGAPPRCRHGGQPRRCPRR